MSEKDVRALKDLLSLWRLDVSRNRRCFHCFLSRLAASLTCTHVPEIAPVLRYLVSCSDVEGEGEGEGDGCLCLELP